MRVVLLCKGQCLVIYLLRKLIMRTNLQYKGLRGALGCTTRNVEVVGSSPIKGPRCFLEQETLPLLLSIGLFQE